MATYLCSAAIHPLNKNQGHTSPQVKPFWFRIFSFCVDRWHCRKMVQKLRPCFPCLKWKMVLVESSWLVVGEILNKGETKMMIWLVVWRFECLQNCDWYNSTQISWHLCPLLSQGPESALMALRTGQCITKNTKVCSSSWHLSWSHCTWWSPVKSRFLSSHWLGSPRDKSRTGTESCFLIKHANLEKL